MSGRKYASREIGYRRPPIRCEHAAGPGGLGAVALYGAHVLFGPFLAPYDPAEADFFNRLAAPSLAHPLGTDQLGRDVLSPTRRLLRDARRGALRAGVALAAGGAAGLFAALSGGVLNRTLMRLAETLMTIQARALALAIAGVLGIGLVTVVASIALVHSAEYARLVRNLVIADWEATRSAPRCEPALESGRTTTTPSSIGTQRTKTLRSLCR